MSTEKDVRELVIVNELSQLPGKAFTIYNKTTGEAFGLDGQSVINIASTAVDKSQDIPLDSGSTTKVPVVAAVEGELNKKVSLSGNEAVAGVKTFSSSPIVPSPTAAQQAASKKYVDDSVARRQAALTFGIADANAVKINDADVAVGDYARFTALGLQGRSASEVISDIGAESIANKNVAGGYAGLDSGGKVLPELLPDFIAEGAVYIGLDSSLGWMIGQGETTTITARVYKGWVEVSAQVLSWIWSRESGDAADDLIWNQAHANSSNVIEISFNDLGNALQQNISCKFTIQATYEDIILNESFTI